MLTINAKNFCHVLLLKTELLPSLDVYLLQTTLLLSNTIETVAVKRAFKTKKINLTCKSMSRK